MVFIAPQGTEGPTPRIRIHILTKLPIGMGGFIRARIVWVTRSAAAEDAHLAKTASGTLDICIT